MMLDRLITAAVVLASGVVGGGMGGWLVLEYVWPRMAGG